MARHSDIRIHVAKLFPESTVGKITQFLNLLVSKYQEGEYIFSFDKEQYTLTLHGSGLFLIGHHHHVFFINDVKKALNEFVSLNETMSDSLYTDLFFKAGTYPEILFLTAERRSVINAKLYSAVMRRIYNSHRDGQDSPIYVNQVVKGNLIGTIAITHIGFDEEKVIVKTNIIKKGEIDHTGVTFLPIKRNIAQKVIGPEVINVKPPVVVQLPVKAKPVSSLFKVKRFFTSLFA